ncbi:hypothetical protein H7J93_26130 [Mycobacterium barrassiae]|uniref:hypothetical protein n=1 Tax=Mycobacterium barrassiae TaxID=319709 RepID=UPI0022658629|nr:hypothetical protein [Mycobacterium barrassiae]MCV7303108.1 hypothetical protein [Mycobacterium barrassiae]
MPNTPTLDHPATITSRYGETVTVERSGDGIVVAGDAALSDDQARELIAALTAVLG